MVKDGSAICWNGNVQPVVAGGRLCSIDRRTARVSTINTYLRGARIADRFPAIVAAIGCLDRRASLPQTHSRTITREGDAVILLQYV